MRCYIDGRQTRPLDNLSVLIATCVLGLSIIIGTSGWYSVDERKGVLGTITLWKRLLQCEIYVLS